MSHYKCHCTKYAVKTKELAIEELFVLATFGSKDVRSYKSEMRCPKLGSLGTRP